MVHKIFSILYVSQKIYKGIQLLCSENNINRIKSYNKSKLVSFIFLFGINTLESWHFLFIWTDNFRLRIEVSVRIIESNVNSELNCSLSILYCIVLEHSLRHSDFKVWYMLWLLLTIKGRRLSFSNRTI